MQFKEKKVFDVTTYKSIKLIKIIPPKARGKVVRYIVILLSCKAKGFLEIFSDLCKW